MLVRKVTARLLKVNQFGGHKGHVKRHTCIGTERAKVPFTILLHSIPCTYNSTDNTSYLKYGRLFQKHPVYVADVA